MRRGGR